MLEKHKKNVVHSILFLTLIFWLTTLITLIFFYLRLKSHIKTLTEPKTIEKKEISSYSPSTSDNPTPPPSSLVTPTAIPIFPDKITFDPYYGDTINIAVPIDKYDSNRQTLTIKVKNKKHTYKITNQTKINLIKNNKAVSISLNEAEKILKKPTTKVMLGSNHQKILEVLILFSD